MMAAVRLLAALAAFAVVLGDQTSHVSISHGRAPAVQQPRPHARPRPVPHQSQRPTYGPQPHPTRPSYRPQPTYPRPTCPRPTYPPRPTYTQRPTYSPRPSYSPRPTYPTTPAYGVQPHAPSGYGSDVPACAAASGKPWCLEDEEYPMYEIQGAAEQNADKLLSLYADVADLNTELSVDLPGYHKEETYLCPSETAYVRPLRAVNSDGKWRFIVNGIKVHYETLTQTTRLEECLNEGSACPLVPKCYESKCLQKSIYHRFLVYDPYDKYFPFAIETFKLPASCGCLLGASTLDH
ncbi:neurotrophin 1-like [Eriocheir sinensis]|uniref:neurotrophin 1-like n=1 Tax=Eriocheir sinensis TaxID=95602 RepID=UPI0021C85269|nr:neurotrophin 1-like [Eriocheir sinensis]